MAENLWLYSVSDTSLLSRNSFNLPLKKKTKQLFVLAFADFNVARQCCCEIFPEMSHEKWALSFAAPGLPAELENAGIFALQQKHTAVLMLSGNKHDSSLAVGKGSLYRTLLLEWFFWSPSRELSVF